MNDKVIIDAGGFTAEIIVGNMSIGPVDIVELHRELGVAMMRARHKDGGGRTRIELDPITLRRA